MATRDYLIYTLDAEQLMRTCRIRGRVDLTTGIDRKNVLLYSGKYGHSALIYQIMKLLDDRKGRIVDIGELTSNLVYLSFGKVDPAAETDMRALLEDGFSIRITQGGEFVKFCSFDKSASMSRSNIISFVNEELFDELDEALNLGLDFTKIDLVPSKYYSYRGLYMTDGIGIAPEALHLNEHSVIVLPSRKFELRDQELMSLGKFEKGNARVALDNVRPVTEIKVDPDDGEGIIDPVYAGIIADCLPPGRGQRPTSFQIRMPFAKGMLHTVDFRRFIREQFPDEDIENIYVTDYFGRKRKLSDARIILTESMFKCAGWIRGVSGDPMKYYFDMFRKYDHAMYIVRTNTNLRADNRIRLNYQFISTLDLDMNTLEALVDRHLSSVRQMVGDPLAARNMLLGMDDDSDGDTESDGFRVGQMNSWEYALLMNPAFISDTRILRALRDTERARVGDTLHGKITCEGINVFLSGDLLSFLIDMAAKCSLPDGILLGVKYEDRIRAFESRELLWSDAFYLPARKGVSLNLYKYYGMLRSPHLSRNEQCAMRPVRTALYKRYFSHLSGVVMISDKSLVPTILGGADFDGDIVKIILNEEINNAILRGAYKKGSRVEINKAWMKSPVQFQVYERKLKPVVIPRSVGNITRIGRHISYEDLMASFSSRVGIISNAAIAIARREYGDGSNDPNFPHGSTALCTIATGLEIDSVKTGIIPDIDGLLELADACPCGFLGIDKEFRKISDDNRNNKKVVYSEYDEEKKHYKLYFRRRGGKRDEILSVDEPDNTLDMLPYLYARDRAENSAGGTRNLKKAATETFVAPEFTFELHDEWKADALRDERTAALKGIIGAYRKLNTDIWNENNTLQTIRDSSMKGRVMTLLFTEYDPELDDIPGTGFSIAEAVDYAYLELYGLLESEQDANACLDRMKSMYWQFVCEFEEREALLEDILGTDNIPAVLRNVVCDTYDNGYQILNFMLQDVAAMRNLEAHDNPEGPAQDADDNDDGTVFSRESKWSHPWDPGVYDVISKMYLMRGRRGLGNWRDEVGRFCRDAVLQLFGGNAARAIQCTFALGREMDENHGFLWNVFTPEDLSTVVNRAEYSAADTAKGETNA